MKVSIGRVQFAYEERGSGVPLVLLHGFPFSRAMWERQLVGLSGAVRVIALDLRGFGESEGVPTTIDGLANDVEAVLEALSLQAVVIGGFSMGGYVLLRYLARFRERVKGVLLISTRVDADTPEVRANRLAAIDRIQKDGPERYLTEFTRRVVAPTAPDTDPSILAKVRRSMGSPKVETLVAALKAMATRPDSASVLATIAVPTLVVAGVEDQIIPMNVMRGMATAIKGAKLTLIPDAGHMVIIEQPDHFTTSVRDFLHPLAKP